jgi:hypothetical protein
MGSCSGTLVVPPARVAQRNVEGWKRTRPVLRTRLLLSPHQVAPLMGGRVVQAIDHVVQPVALLSARLSWFIDDRDVEPALSDVVADETPAFEHASSDELAQAGCPAPDRRRDVPVI